MDDLLELEAARGKKNEGTKRRNLLDELRDSCNNPGSMNNKQTNQTMKELDRALLMFTLHMQMSGQLNEFKDDYFVWQQIENSGILYIFNLILTIF